MNTALRLFAVALLLLVLVALAGHRQAAAAGFLAVGKPSADGFLARDFRRPPG